MPSLNTDLPRVLLPAYQPCSEFGNVCHDMRWTPAARPRAPRVLRSDG